MKDLWYGFKEFSNPFNAEIFKADFTKLCLDTGGKIKMSIGSGADKNGRDDPSSYIHTPGEIAGVTAFSHCQHAIGHTVSSG